MPSNFDVGCKFSLLLLFFPFSHVLMIYYPAFLSYANETKIGNFRQTFTPGTDGKCMICAKTDVNHYLHDNGT